MLTPSFSSGLILQPQLPRFEPILQIHHIRVLGLLHFEPSWSDPYIPVLDGGIGASLEAEVEVAWILRVDAETVHAALGIGL